MSKKKAGKNQSDKLEEILNKYCPPCEYDYYSSGEGVDLVGVKMKKITIKEFMKELEELEPKNVVDYIFKGSALNQWMRKNKIKSEK